MDSSSYSKRPRADDDEEEVTCNKKPLRSFQGNKEEILAPIPLSVLKPDPNTTTTQLSFVPYSKQFWKAGDYEEDSSSSGCSDATLIDGMDHVRVHPRFLHSNATSHKWVLGAVAELLDNSLDEVNNGATYCNIDMVLNKKDGSRMLLVEDNGGGMSPGTMRHCMSLGYSAKSKLANTIGQYGNGFKTSTMRVGADVIVFSRCPGKDGGRPTQSIGLLSYTFLTSTRKEDIVVPMLDYDKEKGKGWSKILRASSSVDWNKNVDTIVQWSPYESEADLLEQFNSIMDQGTRVIIYNLWQDEDGDLELDFDSDVHDIQIRGVNRDEKKIQMAIDYPKSKQFLTYTHSLRSYSSILYLTLPQGFRIILRGQDVVHQNLVNNMFGSEDIKYKPTVLDSAMVKAKGVVGKIGFHKDAKAHLDVQGFNVYHRNRLIKPFWRVWNTPSSGGRGVIGVLEANFVKPAHDKQDFEGTHVLQRLESKLANLQRQYWNKNKGVIGYGETKQNDAPSAKQKAQGKRGNAYANHEATRTSVENGKQSGADHKEKPADQNVASKENEEMANNPGKTSVNRECKKLTNEALSSDLKTPEDQTNEAPQADAALVHELQVENRELKVENRELKERLKKADDKFEELNKEQEAFIDIFSEERTRRDAAEDKLKKQVKELQDKVFNFERKSSQP